MKMHHVHEERSWVCHPFPIDNTIGQANYAAIEEEFPLGIGAVTAAAIYLLKLNVEQRKT